MFEIPWRKTIAKHSDFLLFFFKKRCRLPEEIYPNDTWEVQSDYHRQLIDQFIPPSDDYAYDQCNLYRHDDITSGSTATNISKYACSEWVYSKEIFKESFTSYVRDS